MNDQVFPDIIPSVPFPTSKTELKKHLLRGEQRMLYSRTCQYAIWAMVELGRRQRGQRDRRWVKAEQISETLGLPFPMVAKVLQMLAHAELLESVRGPRGGFRLRRSPEEIHLMEIVIAIDGPGLVERCILGLPQCGDPNPCPLHAYWRPIRDQLRDFLERVTLEDLIHAYQTVHPPFEGWVSRRG